MEKLTAVLGWNLNDDARSLIYVDVGFAEILKWQLGSHLVSEKYVVLPLEPALSKSGSITGQYIPERMAFFVSSSLLDISFTLGRLITSVSCSNATIVTICSPDACKVEGSDENEETDDYAFIKTALSPINVGVIHLPLHLVHLLSSSEVNVSAFSSYSFVFLSIC